MRLITYERGGARRLGAWVGETVVDLPEAVGHPAFPPTMEALVQHIGGSILDAAHDIIEDREVVDEFAVDRPRLLPVLVPSTTRLTVVTNEGVVRTLEPDSFAAGLACIVGAGRARRLSRHESRIFGYTLVAHWTNGNDGPATTSLGPCVVTPEDLNEAPLDLHLQLDGVPCGPRTLDGPDRLFGAILADASQNTSFESGDVVALMCWIVGGSKARGDGSTPHSIELSASPIGVLRADGPK